MAVIRIAFVLIVWLLILSSCSNIPKDIMLVDTNGTKHFHTLQKITNVGEKRTILRTSRYLGICE